MSIITPAVEELKKHLGEEGPPQVEEIERGAIAKFARAIGETNPLYFDPEYAKKTRFGSIVAPPTFISRLHGHGPTFPRPEVPLQRVLHTDDVIEHFEPIRPGDQITVVSRFTDVFEKGGKSGPMLFETITRRMTNQKGQLVATVAMTTVRF